VRICGRRSSFSLGLAEELAVVVEIMKWSPTLPNLDYLLQTILGN
jgi:hypothetical protein